MRNIRLDISYDGTAYAGWQYQKNAKSIQEVIEKALKNITGSKPDVIGSGRTDSGVHAKAQVANFKTRSKLPLNTIRIALNSTLPSDILITAISEASPSFNAQRSAKLKHYRYTVSTAHFTDPFVRHFAARFSYPLDINLIKKVSRALCGRHDFKAFQASGSAEKNTVRTIKNIKVSKKNGFVYIDLWADGFLYNMVRTIAGTLLEIGRGKLPPDTVRRILKEKDRRLCGPTMPAKGLCLIKVEY